MFCTSLYPNPVLSPTTSIYRLRLFPCLPTADLPSPTRDLIAEHGKRATNHRALLEALKEVNQMIQRAARLRVGGPKARVVTQCRAAIKNNNMAALFKIIRDGDGPV